METDYISREAATQAKPEFLNENHEDAEKALYAKGWNACNKEYIDNLLNIPPADVRPVVYCRECRYWNRDHVSCEGLARCLTGETGVRFRNERDFCSRGAKMGGTP